MIVQVQNMVEQSGDVLVQCAGGLMIEHPLLQPYIDHIEGTVDSVMGLSIPLLESMFDQLLKEL